MPRYFNIKGFAINGANYTTIKGVDYNEKGTRISSSGDADKFVSFSEVGVKDCDVSVMLEDALQAQAIMNAPTGDITFQGETDANSSPVTVTITKFKAFGRSGKHEHSKLAAYSISGHASSTDGQAPIVTES
jgi:hypothetical protein